MNHIQAIAQLLDKAQQKESASYAPLIFSMKKKVDQIRIAELIKTKKVLSVIDEWEDQQKELRIIRNPSLLLRPAEKKSGGKNSLAQGIWVFYPWRFLLVHTLEQPDFEKVRISRNQNLITVEEQQKLKNIRVGIAGLNVGNPIAICLALEGVKMMKLADNDPLSLSNLNRFRSCVHQIGMNKAILSAQQIYEINPFADLTIFPLGIVPGKEEEFLLHPKVDVLVEETDHLQLKISIREAARKYRIPVIMVTGNGENVIIDVERYDLNPELPILNGYLKTVIKNQIAHLDPVKKDVRKFVALARDFIGTQHLTKRLQQSFPLVGSALAGIPQLAESSFLRGAAACYAIRQLATTPSKIKSGRYYFQMDSLYA
ncbi:MAG: ThiF family adenylyltransferase [Candidatus Wildermuthbacteria bacterium]|nr:ThiF family adenylyltransferase [Candidatus Wildermuthbacteria bacterium]